MNPLRTWMLISLRSAAWAPLTVLILHVIATRGFNAYHRFPWLDLPFHFFGGVAIAYFLWRSITIEVARPVLGQLSCSGQILFTLAALGTVTVLWEFAEWTTDHFGWTGAQRGLDDTMGDMVIGVFGGVVALLFMVARSRNRD